MENRRTPYDEARLKTYRGILEQVTNAHNNPTIQDTIVSTRRISTIFYPHLNPSSVTPQLIELEANYLQKPMVDHTKIKESLSFFPRLVRAVDDLINIHSFRELRRLGGRFGQLDSSDFYSVIENKLLHSFEWNVDMTTITTQDPSVWSENIVHYMNVILSKVPYIIIKMFGPQIRLSRLSDDLTSDPHASLPEEIVIRQEDFQNLVDNIMSLPKLEQQIVEDLVFWKNGHSQNEVDAVRKMLGNLLGVNPGDYQPDDVKRKPLSRNTRGLTDRNGLSIFHNLELGQVFWIISCLPALEQLAFLIKLRYVKPPDPEDASSVNNMIPTTFFNRVISGKKIVTSYLRTIDYSQVPTLDQPFLPVIEKAQSYFTAGNDGKPMILGRCRRVIFNASQKESFPASLRNLTDRQKQVISLVLDGLTNNEIAAKMKIAPSRVAEHISNASQKLR